MQYPVDPMRSCVHLRAKEMFYLDPESEEEAGAAPPHCGQADTTVYWCECTQTGRGPDGERVEFAACSRPGRSCYVCPVPVELLKRREEPPIA